MNSLFVSSGFTQSDQLVLENGQVLAFASLPPFLRVLMTTDGTVTKSLESFFWEAISVRKQAQRRIKLAHAEPALAKQAGEEVIAREVYLQGDHSTTIYARACSYICPEALPDAICSDLEQDRVGIGELLRECGLETYRELIRFNKETIDDETFITRTYRIVMTHKPFIQITEKFPLRIYESA